MSIYKNDFGREEVVDNFNIDEFLSLINSWFNNRTLDKEIIKISTIFFNGTDILNLWNKKNIDEIEKAEFIYFIKNLYTAKLGAHFLYKNFTFNNGFVVDSFLLSHEIQIFLERMTNYFKYVGKKIVNYHSNDKKFQNITLVQIVDTEIAPILADLNEPTIFDNVHKFNSSDKLEDKRSAIEKIYTEGGFEDKIKAYKEENKGISSCLNLGILRGRINNFVRHNKQKDTKNQIMIDYKKDLNYDGHVKELKEILYGLLYFAWINQNPKNSNQ